MQKIKASSDAGGGLIVAVALNGGSKSTAIMKWALDKFLPQGNNVSFKILHVFPKINGVPTPMGNLIPLPQVRDDVVSAYKKEVEWQKTEMLLPYQRLCSSKKVPADIILIEADDISSAISLEVAKIEAKNLVLGASSNSLFSRKVKGQLLSSLISDGAPGFCTVYVVSKGKLEYRPPSEEANWTPFDDSTSASGSSAFSSSRYSSSTLDPGSSASDSPFASPCQSMRGMKSLSSLNPAFNETTQISSDDVSHWRSLNGDDNDTSSSRSYYASESFSSISENLSTLSQNKSQSLSIINQEIEKLRFEHNHMRGVYLMSQNETTDASEKLSDLSKLRLEEAKNIKQINEKGEKAKELAKFEKEKAEYTKAHSLKEMYKRREGELINIYAAKEKEKAKLKNSNITTSSAPPNHFLCPILKEIMEDPCVAADGYTYDRKAIEMWLKENDTSPTTNFPLSNKNLIPSYTLHYAIMEWKSKNKPPRNSLKSI